MNSVKSSVTRCAGRTIRAGPASRSTHPRPSDQSISNSKSTTNPTTMLSFLYPAGARRQLTSHIRTLPIITKRCYSTPPPPPPSSSPPASNYNLEPSEKAWQYLLGESTEEEEATLKPQRVVEHSPLDLNHSRSFRPKNNDSGQAHRRNNRSFRNNSSSSSHPETPESFSHRWSTHQGGRMAGFNGYNRNPEYKTSPNDGVSEDPSLSLSQFSPSPRTNMTEREKVIFDMIFDKLLQKSPYSSPAKKLQHNRPSPMVSALFESAVGPQSGVDDEVSFGPEKIGDDEKNNMAALLSRGDFPASLRSAAADKLGLSRKAAGLDVLDDVESAERKEEYVKLSGMLELCGTDLEIWEWLDEYIFTMAAVPGGLTGNYPKLLKQAIHTLRTEYEDFPACTAIFEKVKNLGPESYIIGCSVGVYNEMLEVKWRGYRDMSGVIDLLEEMRVNGVDGDEVTAAIVADVLSDVRVFESNSFLPGTGMVWRTEGVLEGKGRLREMMSVLVSEGDSRGLRGGVI